MERRSFIKHTGLAGILAAGSAPAFAQAAPDGQMALRVELSRRASTRSTAGPKPSAKRVAASTNGKFQIQVFAAGEIVPGLQVADAVQNGTVECCHTAPYYFFGKDPTFAFGTRDPVRHERSASRTPGWYHGGGEAALQRVLQGLQHHQLPGAATPARRWAAGSARRSRRSPTSRASSCASAASPGQVLAKLGVVPQQIAGGDIYPALEKGTIDAAEWVGPYDDEKLGFNKVAKFYYYPGWWEGGPALDLFVNIKAFDELPKDYQAVLEARVLREGNTST